MDRRPAESPIARAMAHWKITPADAEAAGREPELVDAQNRCRACAIVQRCEAGLSRRFGRHVPTDCPNAALFADVANHRKVLQAAQGRPSPYGAGLEAELRLCGMVRPERFYGPL